MTGNGPRVDPTGTCIAFEAAAATVGIYGGAEVARHAAEGIVAAYAAGTLATAFVAVLGFAGLAAVGFFVYYLANDCEV